jgi:hypothetical protein
MQFTIAIAMDNILKQMEGLKAERYTIHRHVDYTSRIKQEEKKTTLFGFS